MFDYTKPQKYTLINPALEGVNPYDPHLTAEQKLAILEECKINPAYFFSEVCAYAGDINHRYLSTEYIVFANSLVPGREPDLDKIIAETGVKPQAQIIKLPTGRDVSVMKPRLPFLDPLNHDN